jgi:hypothetical protein
LDHWQHLLELIDKVWKNITKIYGDPLNILFEMSYMDDWNNNIIVPIYQKYFIINKGLYDVKQYDDKIKYYFKKKSKGYYKY